MSPELPKRIEATITPGGDCYLRGTRAPGDYAICGDIIDPTDGEPSHAIATRLAASWNACAGIPTEALESGAVAEMRRILEGFRQYEADCDGPCDDPECGCLFCETRAVLARLEGR